MRGAALGELGLFALAAALLALGSGSEPGAPGFTPGARAPGTLRVVTWNVGGASQGRPHGLQTGDVEHVAETLIALAPDLVFLQEAGELVESIRSRLGRSWNAHSEPGGVAALAAGGLERWRVPAARAVGVRLAFSGRELVAVGLHAATFQARARNEEIGSALDALLERPGDVHLLAGDLNLDLDLDKRDDLFSDDSHLDVETYNYVARSLSDAARGGGPTAEPDRRLDYVFVPAELEVLGAGPWKGRRVGSMDHDPVVADLRLR